MTEAVVVAARPPRVRIQRRPLHGVLLLDKPLGLSSNDALQKAKWLLRAEKAGHTGTLDPLASGLLPLCFGAATKFAQTSLDADKRYLATVKLGETFPGGALAKERAHDVMEAQCTATEIKFQQQRKVGEPVKQVPSVELIGPRCLTPQSGRDARRNLGILDEDRQFREALLLPDSHMAHHLIRLALAESTQP